MSADENHTLLRIALQAAVPLRIDQLRTKHISVILDETTCRELGDDIATYGDIVMYKSEKRGETAKHFNQLVEAIARLAYNPGGVTFDGVHYEGRR